MLAEALLLWFAESERLWGVVCRTVQEQVRWTSRKDSAKFSFLAMPHQSSRISMHDRPPQAAIKMRSTKLSHRISRLATAAVVVIVFSAQVKPQQLPATYRGNAAAEWRNYSGALVPWAYWAKPTGKAWRNIFVSYADGSATRMTVLVDCSSKKLATSNGPLGNLRYSGALQWSRYSVDTGWGQIVNDVCASGFPTPVTSAIDSIPVATTRSLAAAPFRISGNLIYPSEFIPGQKVCAVSVSGLEQRCTRTSSGEKTYSIFVPAGEYLVYSEYAGEKTWATNAVDCSGNASGRRLSPDSGSAYWEEPVKVRIFRVNGDVSDACPVDYYTWEHQLEFPIRVVATDL
jgi:hypothetical protein